MEDDLVTKPKKTRVYTDEEKSDFAIRMQMARDKKKAIVSSNVTPEVFFKIDPPVISHVTPIVVTPVITPVITPVTPIATPIATPITPVVTPPIIAKKSHKKKPVLPTYNYDTNTNTNIHDDIIIPRQFPPITPVDPAFERRRLLDIRRKHTIDTVARDLFCWS